MSVRARVSSGDPVTSDISRSPQAPCPPTNSQVTALHHDLAAPLGHHRCHLLPPSSRSHSQRGVVPERTGSYHWAIYRNDTWQMRPAEGFELAGSIRLIETPGHTPQDVTTLVGTAEGVIALTHLWWTRQGPAEDPFASDSAAIHAARARVLDVADMIIPGHGAPFTPDASTPR